MIGKVIGMTEDELRTAHPAAWEHGRRTGERDRARHDKNPAAYGDDTNPPSRLDSDALTAWLNGWDNGFGDVSE